MEPALRQKSIKRNIEELSESPRNKWTRTRKYEDGGSPSKLEQAPGGKSRKKTQKRRQKFISLEEQKFRDFGPSLRRSKKRQKYNYLEKGRIPRDNT
jgi:hypothetical protein